MRHLKRIILNCLLYTTLLSYTHPSLSQEKVNVIEQQLTKTLHTRNPIKIVRNLPKTETFTKANNALFELLRDNTRIQPLIIQFPVLAFNKVLNQNLYLSYSEVHKKVTLQNIQLKNPITIFLTHFTKPINSYSLIFDKNMTLQNSIIDQTCHLQDNYFHSKANFTSSTFKKSFSLAKSTFEKKANFSNSVFHKGINLSWSRFSKSLSFQHAVFFENSNLSHATFDHGLNLSGASLHGNINLSKSFINGEINLKNFSIVGNSKLDLTRITTYKKNKDIPINLEGTTLANLAFNYRYFHLYFDKGTSHYQKIRTYTNLLEYLKKEGQTKGYNKLLREFRSYRLQYNKHYISDSISNHFWSYGTDMAQALRWILTLYVIFTIINASIFPILAKDYPVISSFSNVHLTSDIKHNFISRFVCYLPFSVFFTLFLMVGGFLRLGLNIATLKGSNLLISMYILIVCITGFLGMLFIISLII